MRPPSEDTNFECEKADRVFLSLVGVTDNIYSKRAAFRHALSYAGFSSSAKKPDDLNDEDWDVFLLSLAGKIDAVHVTIRQTPEQVCFPEQMNTHIEGDVVPLMAHLKEAWKVMKSEGMSHNDVTKLLKQILKVCPTVSRSLIAKIYEKGLSKSNMILIDRAIFMPAGKIFILSQQDLQTFYRGDIEGNWQYQDSPSFGRVWFGDIRWDDQSLANDAPSMFLHTNNLILKDQRSCQRDIRMSVELYASHPNSFSRELEKKQPITEETFSPFWKTLTCEEEYQHFKDQKHRHRYHAVYPNKYPDVHPILSPNETFLTNNYLHFFPKSSESHTMYLATSTLISTIDELSGRLHSLITLLRENIENKKFDEAYTLFLYRAAEFERGRESLNAITQRNDGKMQLSPHIAHTLAGKLILDNFGEGNSRSAEEIVQTCQQPPGHPAIHAYNGLLAALDRLLLSMDQREKLLQSTSST